MANRDSIEDVTNITGITGLLNSDRIDKSIASQIERELNDVEKTNDNSEYDHNGFIQDVNNLFKQLINQKLFPTDLQLKKADSYTRKIVLFS